ncbi:replication-relaxation family protein [Amycolatopsis rhizosphaerae]|uniref:replication-relaxation family protein n=1 Tax=Amycolatopsis rhizosphaerae TaxID=2053003 RepID=UPI00164381C2|nr:replication-relaxation family protein [Amycolatopsis rhizosphaerae]
MDIRPAGKADLLTRSRGLTARDAEVLSYLARHRVLTALQLARLVFGSYSHARSRLAVLHERGVLARFRRDIWPGSQPWRYTLGPIGAIVHAAATGAALPRPATVTETVLRLAHSAHTEHRLGVNDFFATLAGHSQHHDGRALGEWWPENEVGATCAGIVRPDGYGEYSDHDRTLGFFYEYDTGTETLDTLVEKVGKYAELADAGICKPILFHLPSASREHHFHAAVTRRWPVKPPVPIATMPADQLAPPGHHIAAASPSIVDALWRPIGHTRRRTLADLAPRTTRQPTARTDAA